MEQVGTRLVVGRAEEFEHADRKLVVDDSGVTIGVFKVGDRYVAYENRCQHQGGPVCEGRILGRVEVVLEDDRNVLREQLSDSVKHIVCPWHGYEYDISTGECSADRRLRLNRHEAYEEGGTVYLVV